MGDWKQELRSLVTREKQREQEVEECVEQNLNLLRRSREEVGTFIESEVLPTLKEIAPELQTDVKAISIESIDSGATMTIASGARLPGERKYTHEVQYRVEVDRFAKTAKGSLLMLNVVPGTASQKDLLVGQLEVSSSGDPGNAFGISREDIRNNFLQLYRAYVN